MPVTRILHRGGNSRDLLDSPAHLAVDAIEADVWVHDHRILVHHARPLRPLPISVGAGGFRRIRRDGIRLPELSEAVLANDAELILDLRSYFGDPSPDVVRELLELPARSHISVSCESWWIGERLRAWLPDLEVLYSVRRERQLRAFLSRSHELDGRPLPGVAVKHTLLHSPAEVEALRRRAERVTVWTIDDVDRALELISWGVDKVTSNHISVLNAI